MALSSLTVAKRLIDAGVPRTQAEAQAEIWSEIVESELATKRDLKDIELRISGTEASLKRDVASIEASLKRDVASIEANLKRDIKELELKMERGLSDVQRNTLQVGIGMAALMIAALGFLFRFMAR